MQGPQAIVCLGSPLREGEGQKRVSPSWPLPCPSPCRHPRRKSSCLVRAPAGLQGPALGVLPDPSRGWGFLRVRAHVGPQEAGMGQFWLQSLGSASHPVPLGSANLPGPRFPHL